MSQGDQDMMRDEYDFSSGERGRGERGRHHKAYRQGTNVVLLDADVAEVFRDSESVNRVLRTIAQLARDHARKRSAR